MTVHYLPIALTARLAEVATDRIATHVAQLPPDRFLIARGSPHNTCSLVSRLGGYR